MRSQEGTLRAFMLKAGAPGLLMVLDETVRIGTHFSSCDSRDLSGFIYFEAMILSVPILLAQAIRLTGLHVSFALPSPTWQKQSKDQPRGSHCLQTHCTLARCPNLCVERQQRLNTPANQSQAQ